MIRELLNERVAVICAVSAGVWQSDHHRVGGRGGKVTVMSEPTCSPASHFALVLALSLPIWTMKVSVYNKIALLTVARRLAICYPPGKPHDISRNTTAPLRHHLYYFNSLLEPRCRSDLVVDGGASAAVCIAKSYWKVRPRAYHTL